jgi:hypothetical protein
MEEMVEVSLYILAIPLNLVAMAVIFSCTAVLDSDLVHPVEISALLVVSRKLERVEIL